MHPIDGWPGWHVVIREMDVLEMIVPTARLVILDPSVADPEHHAWAHLELGDHERVGPIPDWHESWALQMAELRGLEVA